MSKDLYFEMAEIENKKFYYQIIITKNQNNYENFNNNYKTN